MKNKILVIISEGGSEPSFIKEFLKIHYGFKNSELTGKGQEIIEKDDFYVFFSHPVCINGCYGSRDGGDSTILEDTTYIKVKSLIKQHFSHLLSKSEIIYFIQTDINRKQEKEEAINKNIKKCPAGDLHISFSSLMIESWFISGLGIKLLGMYGINKKSLNKFFKSNIDTYQNIKTELDNLLPDYISGNRNEIGRDFGKYIDIEKAKEKSNSFKDFIEKINKIFS